MDRERGVFLPLTDEVLQGHLSGRQTIGVYPLLRDETCWFLAVDFDKEHWQEDVTAYLAACDRLRVPAALERSRSGNGGHVWVFFDAPVPAAQTRKLGCALLTLAIGQRRQIGLDSYDRLFPNQDTLPKGGFGNLIALPLQRTPRQAGNSVFLDRGLTPYPDQWAILSSVQRMRQKELDRIVATATRAGTVIGVRSGFVDQEGDEDPWTSPPSGKRLEKRIAGPFPLSVRVTMANLVYVAKEDLPSAMLSRLWRFAAFQNPEFYRAQAMRLSTFGKPRVISCAEEFDRHIGLPRGCLHEVRELLAAHDVGLDLVDERQTGRVIDFTFHGQLTPIQEQAAKAVLAQDTGVLCAPTAFGKTVVAAWLIAARRVNTLVLVHRKQLLDQWRERLSTFLDLPLNAIGQVSGGQRRTNGQIDVALVQSLCRKGEVEDVVAEYGHVIVDECHHIPAFTFERVLKATKARFVLGLTATPIRKDGHHPIIVMQCGPLRFRVSPKDEVAARSFEQTVVPRITGFSLADGVDVSGIQGVYAALAAAEKRNDLICSDLLNATREGRTPLLLTERKDHLEEFARRLEGRVHHIVVLHGGMGIKKRRAIAERLQAIPPEEPCAILATGRYAGEGFDHARLDTLLLALPISWRGTLRQYAGRIQREHPGKREVRIYDFVDVEVPILARMYEKRRKGYLAMGYRVQSASSLVESLETPP
ncbi:MAG: DEAD/DEAH box helicase family protein [Chloroflexota bacterium]|nr:DEAD/DEAH box helicase family protein [Chloroflexota bacterium]